MKIKVINKSIHALPAYETAGSAGMDIRTNEPIILKQGEIKVVGTGLYFEIPTNYEMQIRSRSGLALNRGVIVLNSPATIDSDFRGEVKVILYNASTNTFKANAGDRIAQVVFSAYQSVILQQVEVLEDTERGENGLGSTGLK